MKVLVLAPPLKTVGGIQRYLTTLVYALEELFDKPSVHLLAVENPLVRDSLLPARLGTGAKARFLTSSIREVAAWRPDLVICGHVALAPLCWLLRALWGQHYWVIGYGIEVWGRLGKWSTRALVHADGVVAISEFTREQMIQLQGVPRRSTCLLPPALDQEWLSEAASCTAAFHLSRRPTVLTVGRLLKSERYKGHDVILHALPQVRRKIPQILYVIVGDGDDRGRLENLAHSLGLADSVRFVGAASPDLLKACYRECDVFLMPSETVLDRSQPKGEGFGIVFLEAMAYGKPVIGPDFGAPSEFIRHGQHGLLVTPDDLDGVVRALIELLTAPARAREMGAAARDWVQKEYCYSRFRERLRQLFFDPSLAYSKQAQCES